MTSIRECMRLPRETLSSIERQTGYVGRRYAEPHHCEACGGTHTVWDCAPVGMIDGTEFPENSDLNCPDGGGPLQHCLSLWGDQWLARRVPAPPAKEGKP